MKNAKWITRIGSSIFLDDEPGAQKLLVCTNGSSKSDVESLLRETLAGAAIRLAERDHEGFAHLIDVDRVAIIIRCIRLKVDEGLARLMGKNVDDADLRIEMSGILIACECSECTDMFLATEVDNSHDVFGWFLTYLSGGVLLYQFEDDDPDKPTIGIKPYCTPCFEELRGQNKLPSGEVLLHNLDDYIERNGVPTDGNHPSVT